MALRRLCAQPPPAPSIGYAAGFHTAQLRRQRRSADKGDGMKWQALRGVAVAGVMAMGPGAAGAAQADVGGTLALASDYVWRGSSQTGEDPAVQAGARATHGTGLYASVWGSNVAFEPDSGARSEFDAVLGWSGELAPNWSLDANATRYLYPGTGRALDWTELSATATFKQRAWLQLAHSRDALAGGHPGTYAQIGMRLPLSGATRLEAAYGHYALASAQARGYQHVQLSVIHAIAPKWELRATGHATDNAARQLFPGNAGSRLEVALQAAF